MFNSVQCEAPLVEALTRYIKQPNTPFHMPGHKGGAGAGSCVLDLLGRQAFFCDLTEIGGLDDLHNPVGVIKKAQELAGLLMGAKTAYFLVNGVTAGIHASVLAMLKAGEKIILPRNAHRSVYGAIAIGGGRPVYLKPRIDQQLGFPLGLDLGEVKTLFSKNRDACGTVLVHPTYHGFASDMEAIINCAGEYGISVLADEAHGAHFRFSQEFPCDALSCGAAITVQGWHKTMGSLTQSALLLTNSLELNIREYLMVLQSTSPSYLLMASLDAARQHWAQEGRSIAEEMLELAFLFRRELKKTKGIICLDRETLEGSPVIGIDPTKIVLSGEDIGLNGFCLAKELRETYRIEPEMAEYGGVTLMITPGDTGDSISSLLWALKDIAARFSCGTAPRGMVFESPDIPEMVIPPGDAMKMTKRSVPIEEVCGEIIGEYLCPYPPGIPLAVPGEMITKDIIRAVKNIINWGGKVQGPADPQLKTVQVIDR